MTSNYYLTYKVEKIPHASTYTLLLWVKLLMQVQAAKIYRYFVRFSKNIKYLRIILPYCLAFLKFVLYCILWYQHISPFRKSCFQTIRYNYRKMIVVFCFMEKPLKIMICQFNHVFISDTRNVLSCIFSAIISLSYIY